ncbi:HNH endonuclease signature motif containing protein [Naumannella halotolerans]|uniref:HNH endonuclease signature motif containing protein n=1 Tax=Naumannella halotolerans TaxID=993414 RepID=UPI00370D6A34
MTGTHIVDQHAALRAATTRLWEALRDRLNGACAWADTHPLTDQLVDRLADPDQAVTGGEGTPLVDPASVAEFAALLGKPTGAGFRIIGEALELRHRLPRLWERVQSLEVSAEDGCRVAARTMSLSPTAARWVDDQLVHFVGALSTSQLERTVEAAKTSTGAPAEDESSVFVHLVHDRSNVNGHSRLFGELSRLDALELDQALQHGAELQKLWGNQSSVEVRRAHALAELARSQSMLPPLPQPPRSDDGDHEVEPMPISPDRSVNGLPAPVEPRPPAPRPIALTLILPEPGANPAGTSGHPAPGRLGNLPVTAEQVAIWCGAPGAQITVRPVIDLNLPESTDCYAPTDRIREHVRATHPTCVFPFCDVPTERADLDHIVPFDAGGATTTDNLAPLCRRHHRLKTHHGWRYRRLGQRLFGWSSPEVESYLRDGPRTLPFPTGPARRLGPEPIDEPADTG